MARICLASNTDFYVDASGNDAANGLVATPWRTLTHAYDWVRDNVDFAGKKVTVHVADGSYEPADFNGRPTGIKSEKDFLFTGNPGNSWAVNIVAGYRPAIVVDNDACVMIEGMSPQTGGSGPMYGVALAHGRMRIGSMGWRNCPSGYVTVSGTRSYMTLEGGHALVSSTDACFIAELGCTFTFEPGTQLGLNGIGGCNIAFVIVDDCANMHFAPYVQILGPITQYGYSGAATANGILSTYGVHLPGNGNYNLATGGQLL